MKKTFLLLAISLLILDAHSQTLKPRSILLTGDSRFGYAAASMRVGYGGPVFSETGDVFQNHFAINGRTITNWGGAGYHISNVHAQVPSILSGGFDKVIIQVGTADAFSHGLYPNSYWDSVLIKLYPTVKQIFVTEPIYFVDETAYSTWGFSKTEQKSYNDSLHRLCNKYSYVKWIPTNYLMCGSNGYLKPEYAYDKIHQTYLGYLAMMDAVDEIVIY
jgi:hypothetical protein